jgi:hypothetical protein
MTQAMYGYVIDNGNEIYLKQQAYLCGTYENPHYTAYGEDSAGNGYKIIWQIKITYLPLNTPAITPEDEADMCDWDDFEVISLN